MVAMREQEQTVVRIAGFSDDYSAEMGPIYEDVPMISFERDERPEPRNYNDFVMAVVGALLLAIAAVTWKWIW